MTFVLIGKVRAFNTGRLYAADGQRISWAVFRDVNTHKTVVVFIDHSRMVDGVIDLHFGNLDLVNDGWVLRAYDDHHYHYSGGLVMQLRREIADNAIKEPTHDTH